MMDTARFGAFLIALICLFQRAVPFAYEIAPLGLFPRGAKPCKIG